MIKIHGSTSWVKLRKLLVPAASSHNHGNQWKMGVPPWKLTWLAGNPPWTKMYFLLKMGMFQCHVSFQECISNMMFPFLSSEGNLSLNHDYGRKSTSCLFWGTFIFCLKKLGENGSYHTLRLQKKHPPRMQTKTRGKWVNRKMFISYLDAPGS